MQNVRIYEIPDCKMVSSGVGMFGDEGFNVFENFLNAQKQSIFPKNFLFWDGNAGGLHWLYLYEEGMSVPAELEVIDFKGGLYAVATDIDQHTDMGLKDREVDAFLNANGFVRDFSRPDLGNVITPPAARQVMGYEQMDYYTPIKVRE